MAKKKVVLTLMRVYKKEVEVDVSDSRFDGLSNEEIQDILIEEDASDYNRTGDDVNDLFHGAEYKEFDNVEGDRYDIYEDGKEVYGGHL